jgi:hypothetical protein
MSLHAYLDEVLRPAAPASVAGRTIGLVGTNIPVELIFAADATPVQLGVSLDACDTVALADRFLESSFSRQTRVVAQQWLSGALNSFEAVIFSRSDDSAQRLYYYLCELQRLGEFPGPQPLIYDVARIQRASSLAHTIESTHLLACELEVQQTRLPAAAQRVSARADLVQQLMSLRASHAVPLGSLAHRIIRAARVDWSERFEDVLKPWLLAPETATPRKRILLVGSVPADEQLHLAVESSGAVIIGEINEAIPPVGSATSLEAIARRIYEQTCTTRRLLQSPDEIVKMAHALRADGVIVWMLATDTGLAWEAPRIERAMSDAGVPVLMLTSQPDAQDDNALAQVRQFVTEWTPQ